MAMINWNPVRMYRWLFKKTDVACVWSNKQQPGCYSSQLYKLCKESWCDTNEITNRLRDWEWDYGSNTVYPPSRAHGLLCWIVKPQLRIIYWESAHRVMVVLFQKRKVGTFVSGRCKLQWKLIRLLLFYDRAVYNMSLHALIYIVPYCQQKILHCSIFILQIWFKRLWICCWGEGTGCVSRGGATGWIVWWSKHWGIFTTGCTTKHTAAATELYLALKDIAGF